MKFDMLTLLQARGFSHAVRGCNARGEIRCAKISNYAEKSFNQNTTTIHNMGGEDAIVSLTGALFLCVSV